MNLKAPLKGLKYKLPAEVTRKLSRSTLVASKHSPAVLFGAGVVGVVATVVLACRATLKVSDILDDSKEKLQKLQERKEHVEEVEPDNAVALKSYEREVNVVRASAAVDMIKLYGPPVIIGVASVAALAGSHIMLTNRLAGVTAAYTALDQAFVGYRKRVIDKYGDDEDRELRYGVTLKEIVEEGEEGPEVKTLKRVDPNTHSGYARFFDKMSPSWERVPEYNLLFLKCQQNWANDKLHAEGHLFLNEVYDRLGIPRSRAGTRVGWFIGKGDSFVDFGIFDAQSQSARDFVNGNEGAILVDFNVAGIIQDLI